MSEKTSPTKGPGFGTLVGVNEFWVYIVEFSLTKTKILHNTILVKSDQNNDNLIKFGDNVQSTQEDWPEGWKLDREEGT